MARARSGLKKRSVSLAMRSVSHPDKRSRLSGWETLRNAVESMLFIHTQIPNKYFKLTLEQKNPHHCGLIIYRRLSIFLIFTLKPLRIRTLILRQLLAIT